MTEQEARTIMAVLVAAYPRATIEDETMELYVRQLERLQSPEVATRTVQVLLDSARDFPSLAEFRDTYMAERRKDADAIAHERGLPPAEREPLPDWVRDFAAKLGRDDDSPEARVHSLPPAEAGECSDCRRESDTRYVFGKMTVCGRCALHRLRARAKVAAIEKPAATDEARFEPAPEETPA